MQSEARGEKREMTPDEEMVNALLLCADEYQGRAEGDFLSGESRERVEAWYYRCEQLRRAAGRLMEITGCSDPCPPGSAGPLPPPSWTPELEERSPLESGGGGVPPLRKRVPE